MSTTDDPQEKTPISVWRRLLALTGVLILFFVVLAVSRWGYERARAASRLRELMADLDEKDPNWRLDEIEANRADPPAGKNSALVITAIVKLLPKGSLDFNLDEALKLNELPAPERLADGRMKLLDEELSKVTAALAMARRLADMPEGRHKLVHNINPLTTLLPDQQETRRAAHLLSLDALQQAQKSDVNGALLSCRACLNAGRSLGDEPFFISQLIRTACVDVALKSAERSLALGEASEADLAAWQRLVELEEKHPTLLVGMRGERAMMQKLWDGLASGVIPTKGLLSDLGARRSDGNWRELLFPISPGEVRRQQPEMLDLMNRAVAIARMPPHEQARPMKELELELRTLQPKARVVALLLPALMNVSMAFNRKGANLTAMRVLVAAERYRTRNGKWPEKIEDLTPTFLDRVPLDPFDGKPIRYRRLPDGVVVYSVGDDGIDNGGSIDRNRPPTAPGTDQGYRLWDVPKRRLPPRPAPKPGEAPGGPGPPPGGPAPAPPPPK